MTAAVATLVVTAEEAGLRLDRWFKRHFPSLGHARLERLLRTGQVRIDGKRAKAGARVAAGESVRVPPLGEAPEPRARPRAAVSADDRQLVQSLVLYRDDEVLALNKPPGLAVQGGTGTARHLDAMLDALRFGCAERPRLVHRLDRDTSGVLLLARNALVARKLAEAFRAKTTRKLYWALTAGVPKPFRGRIDLPIAKLPGRAGERMAPDEEEGKRAITYYRVLDHLGRKAAWVALWPLDRAHAPAARPHGGPRHADLGRREIRRQGGLPLGRDDLAQAPPPCPRAHAPASQERPAAHPDGTAARAHARELAPLRLRS